MNTMDIISKTDHELDEVFIKLLKLKQDQDQSFGLIERMGCRSDICNENEGLRVDGTCE